MKISRGTVHIRLLLTVGLGCGVISNALHASGFAIPEMSIAGLGTANALVANHQATGAIIYNPAAMAFHEQSSISAGLMLFNPSLEVTNTAGAQESQGDETIPVPSFQAALKVNDQWNLGLGISAPFGLETAWPIGTFPALSTAIPIAPGVSLPPGLFHPTLSKLELAAITPTVSFKISDNFSVAAGADYYDARKLAFNTHLVTIRGDGSSWGWNLAAMYVDGPLSIGASYHTASTVGLDGSFTLLGSPTIDAEADLDLPSRFQVGVRYRFTDTLAAELDWSRMGWSSFKTIQVKAKASGAVLTQSDNQWDDANAFRLGITYDLSAKTELRFGFTYDETGQGGDYFSARIPDADRLLFSLGAAHDFGSGWEVEGGYMYVKFDDNDYRADKSFSPLNGDPNGTTALDGDYRAHVHIVGLGVNKTF